MTGTNTDISGPTVMSVLGPVAAASLGRVLVHEHLQIRMPGSELDLKSRLSRREVVKRAVDRLWELREHGVATFVDPCPIELGRDVELMAEVSERSGVNIVCATGFYYEVDAIGIPFYWRMRWPEEIAEFYVGEIDRGVGDTGIRPGLIKAATGPEVGRHERKVLVAAAQAARATGVPIVTHTTESRQGSTQQDLFEGEGADLTRCLIGHQDETKDAGELARIAARGSFVGIDRVGYETLAADEHRLDLATGLRDEGLLEHLCLSQDHLCVGHPGPPGFWIPKERAASIAAELMPRLDSQSYGASSARIFTHFVPKLIDRGFTDGDIETVFRDNPRRLLCGTDVSTTGVQYR